MITKKGWYMFTDGEKVFHPVFLDGNNHVDSGQYNVIMAQTEDELFKKVFKSPKRDKDGLYNIKKLNKKGKRIILTQKMR